MNWAKESSMLSVKCPVEVVVLNCCVTETDLAPNFYPTGK